MNVVIRTGFAKVTHAINFQPETEPKGIKLFKANHVRCVQEYRQNGRSLFIQAQVVRQASASSEPYRTQLNIDANRLVKGVSCTCVYNQSGRCKHVAALIYYVNNYESLSKTNFEQQFVKEKYSKEASSQQIESDINSLVTILEESVEQDERRKDCEVCLLNIHNFIEEYPLYCSEYVLCDTIKQFFETHIKMTSENIIDLCSKTIDQAMSSKWELARSLRFSACSTIHKIKVRKTKTIESLLEDLFFPSKSSVPSMKYGKDNESVARKLYETMFDKEVKEVGVIVSKYQPWLCASPDGIVIEDGCIVGLVEIKCPSSCEKFPIVDVENKKCNVTYLKYVGEEIILKKSHPYNSDVCMRFKHV